jgi:2-polyprenyl-3-methyl-5-hydroxy-6-metoxy-1,4-benzoquinol methylase
MEIIKRDKCVLNKNEKLSELCCFNNFPIYMGCINTPSDSDVFSDMKWGYSTSSGLVQLMNLIPLDVLYSKHHNPGITGKIWEDHHLNFSNLIKKSPFKKCLEIGGATGTLFKHFLEDDKKFNWSVLEPSGVFNIKDDRVNIISDYFENFSSETKYDIVVHSHVLEHVYEPMGFIKKVRDVLVDGGYHYISIPNMRQWLLNGYTNTLMFEHTYYIDEYVLEFILNNNGFIIEEMIINEHSIMVKSKKVNKVISCDWSFEYSKKLFQNYYANIFSDVNSTLEKVKDKFVYIFGAHIFSQIFINLGLDERKVISILDNNVEKQGKRLYGTKLMVNSPDVLIDIEAPIVIVRAGAYTKEIMSGILNINKSVIFC